MKIMTAMYTMRRGGAYDRFLMMIEAFLERGWEVHCLSLTPIRIRHSHFKNHLLYWPFGKIDSLVTKLFVLLIFPLWAFGVGLKNRINIIIAYGALYAFIQGLSKYLLKKPMVTLIRGDSHIGLRVRGTVQAQLYLNQQIESIGLRFSDLIITNNNGLKEEILRKLKNERHIDVKVLFNNISPIPVPDLKDINLKRARYGIEESAKVIVTAGVLNQGKRVEWLINCLKNIRVGKLHLFIVGTGSKKADFHYKEYLKGLTQKLKIEEQVHFTGWVDKEELGKIFHVSDLFVMPSINEGMPNAMLEALGLGLPCIGSRIPGIIDILQYDELLFDPINEEELAHKIRLFFSDQQYSNKVKMLCEERKKAFIFDWKERVFQVVTNKHPSLVMN